MGISRTEALDSFRSNDLIGIGMEADAVRRRLHPEGVVSYAVQCSVQCEGEPSAVCARAAELMDAGGSGIRLSGGMDAEVEPWVRAISELRRAFPEAWIEGLTTEQVQRLGSGSQGGVAWVLERLERAGLSSIADQGPDLAAGDDAVAEWLAVHRAAHRAGMRTVAAMRFGAGEGPEQRVNLLEAVSRVQQETGGFSAFAPVSAGAGLQGPTAVECLKTVAICRLVLATVEHVQAVSVQGLKVLETALRFGANDAGVVLAQASRAPDLREEDLRRVIRDAGFAPVERDLGFRMQFA